MPSIRSFLQPGFQRSTLSDAFGRWRSLTTWWNEESASNPDFDPRDAG
jgi:hypothetical protein